MPPARPAIDHGVPDHQLTYLDRLAAAVGSDFVEELIDDFGIAGQERLAEMRAGLVSGNCMLLDRAAHTLKSMGLTLGFVEIGAACHSLELLAQTEVLDGAGVWVEKIATHLNTVDPLKREWCSRHPAPPAM